MDSSKYTEKCLGLLENNGFAKITDDPTKRIESKIQRCVRKLKSKITKEEYSKLYPTGSNPGKFYGTAKIHKLSYNDSIDQLPLRPIVSNIGTASYHLSKYLAKLLSPLSQSEYTVKNSKEFIQKFKNVVRLDSNSKLVSFDVSYLLTSVPLGFIIDVILRRIYRNKEIVTNITLNELKELLLCTKNVHFSFNGQFYLHKDGIAMGSPLGLS